MRTGMSVEMRRRGWRVVVAVLLVGGLLAPSSLIAEGDETYTPEYSEEEGPLKDCLDRASKEYNACLNEAGTWWGRTMCDVIYESEVALCWAEQLGKIRKAFNGDDEELN
jgi:hypothetical protein